MGKRSRQIPAIIGGDQKSRHGVVLQNLRRQKVRDQDGETGCKCIPKCPNLYHESTGS